MGSEQDIPLQILQKSSEATGKLIPVKSCDRYNKEFKLFKEWKLANKVIAVNEDVMLAYMLDLSKKMSSSSLWAKYSMIKSMLLVHENVDISRFWKVTAFLKKQSVGYEAKKAKALTRDEVNRFMKEAPDEKYLLAKVVAMFGIAGGCRREELHNISLDDVQDTGTQLIVTIPVSKTHQRRVFTVINEVEGMAFLELYRRYVKLRPKNLPHKMLFIGYRNGSCISQRAGIHTIGGMPRKIAEFLGLQNPEKYTGHCFRRTSATLLANAGVDLCVLKRHGGWKSSSVAEKYIEESIEGKTKIARMIQGGENFVEVLEQQKNKISDKISTKISNEVLTKTSDEIPTTFAPSVENGIISHVGVKGNKNSDKISTKISNEILTKTLDEIPTTFAPSVENGIIPLVAVKGNKNCTINININYNI